MTFPFVSGESFLYTCERRGLVLLLNLVGSNNIERTSSIEFLGVMLDRCISWIDHVRTVEDKIAKNIGLLHRVS